MIWHLSATTFYPFGFQFLGDSCLGFGEAFIQYHFGSGLLRFRLEHTHSNFMEYIPDSAFVLVNSLQRLVIYPDHGHLWPSVYCCSMCFHILQKGHQINKRWTASILDVRTFRGANCGVHYYLENYLQIWKVSKLLTPCNTDNNFVINNFRYAFNIVKVGFLAKTNHCRGKGKINWCNIINTEWVSHQKQWKKFLWIMNAPPLQLTSVHTEGGCYHRKPKIK